MALVNCPECKSEVSDQAPNCPKCGFVMAKPAKKLKAKPIAIGCLVAVILLIAWAAIS